MKLQGTVRCFFEVAIDEVPTGRIVFELYNNVCPKTCENFRALCTGKERCMYVLTVCMYPIVGLFMDCKI